MYIQISKNSTIPMKKLVKQGMNKKTVVHNFDSVPILTIGTGQGTEWLYRNGPALPYPDPIM